MLIFELIPLKKQELPYYQVMVLIVPLLLFHMAQSAEAVKYIDCISAEG